MLAFIHPSIFSASLHMQQEPCAVSQSDVYSYFFTVIFSPTDSAASSEKSSAPEIERENLHNSERERGYKNLYFDINKSDLRSEIQSEPV